MGGAYAGKPAITTHTAGKGKAIYLGAHLDPASLARVLITIERMAGIVPAITAPPGVEITTRQSGATFWTYLMNHSGAEQAVSLKKNYKDALTGTSLQGSQTLEPYGVRVLLSNS